MVLQEGVNLIANDWLQRFSKLVRCGYAHLLLNLYKSPCCTANRLGHFLVCDFSFEEQKVPM